MTDAPEAQVLPPIIAMPPPVMLLIWPAGLVFVLTITALFVYATGGTRGEQDRRAGLGLLAIVSGPLIGALIAWSINSFSEVHPDDVGYNYAGFIVIGSIAGVMAGIAFAVTALAASGHVKGEKSPAKHPDLGDEL